MIVRTTNAESKTWFESKIFGLRTKVKNQKLLSNQNRTKMCCISWFYPKLWIQVISMYKCNVSSLDETPNSSLFFINDDQFKIYNKGHVELGDHNKDKNGELTMPVTFKIMKKKLNCA